MDSGIIYSQFILQADEGESTETISDYSLSITTEESGTVQFWDSASGEEYVAPSYVNSVAKVDGTEDLSLGKFLSRPTTINSFTWNNSDPVGQKQAVSVWYDYMANSVIKKKLDNYAFLRGKLHIKILINATPFQYGTIRACYYPLFG